MKRFSGTGFSFYVKKMKTICSDIVARLLEKPDLLEETVTCDNIWSLQYSKETKCWSRIQKSTVSKIEVSVNVKIMLIWYQSHHSLWICSTKPNSQPSMCNGSTFNEKDLLWMDKSILQHYATHSHTAHLVKQFMAKSTMEQPLQLTWFCPGWMFHVPYIEKFKMVSFCITSVQCDESSKLMLWTRFAEIFPGTAETMECKYKVRRQASQHSSSYLLPLLHKCFHTLAVLQMTAQHIWSHSSHHLLGYGLYRQQHPHLLHRIIASYNRLKHYLFS